jgi:hypothetical protein
LSRLPACPACLNEHTQVAFKGYEEARVALTCLLFSIPCCIIIGVEYGVFMNGELKLRLKVRPGAAAGAAADATAAKLVARLLRSLLRAAAVLGRAWLWPTSARIAGVSEQKNQ